MEIQAKTIVNDLEYLRQVSEEVDLNDPMLKDYITTLKNYFSIQPALAMAAVQVGIPKRLIYIRNTNYHNLVGEGLDEARVLINPKIIKKIGHTRYWEACVSCLELMGLVDRPYQIELEYYQEDGTLKREIFTGFEATVLSHEYDHLDGILHIDRAIQVYELPQDKRKEFRYLLPNDGYEIISKDGTFEYEPIKIKKKSIL